MHDDGSAATAMLGLAGFVLLAVSEYAGEVEQAIETTAAVAFCRGAAVQRDVADRLSRYLWDTAPDADEPPSGGQ